MSIAAMNDFSRFRSWELNPYLMTRSKEYHRVITHGFIHAGWMHLFINMFVLWQFGQAVEHQFIELFGNAGYLYYSALYIGALIVAALPALKKHQDNPNYRAVGASGAVAAVLFSYILFFPVNMLYLFLMIPIPAVLVGVLYLWYENKMKNSGDNIAHDAHYYGAVFGFAVTVLFKPVLLISFVQQIADKLMNLF